MTGWLILAILFALIVCAELYSMRGMINDIHEKLDGHIRKAESALPNKLREAELKEALRDMITLCIELDEGRTTQEQTERISNALNCIK